MSKYIELISQIKPKNNLSFPIADTLDLIGGYVQVNNINERNSIDSAKLRKGMLCYVSDEDIIYKYSDTSWEEFKISGNIYNLDYPGFESFDNKSFTEEEYNSILNSPIIIINNKYIVYSKKFNTTTELLELGSYISTKEILIISIDSNYDAQVNSYSILNSDDIANITGNSTSRVMSQNAITKELNKKQNAFDIGKGLALSEDGSLYCTLDDQIFQVVDTLPADGLTNKIYLVNNHSSEQKNVYSEYMWVNAQWELVGTHNSELNLDDYVTKADLDTFESELFNEIYLDDILEFGLCNKETGELFDPNKDTLYNDKSFHLKNWLEIYISVHFKPKTLLTCGNIVASVIGFIKGRENLISVLCSEVSTEKLLEFVIEFDNTESEYATVYFTDFDYLTKKDLTTVNSQLQLLDNKINTIPVPNTYYEVSNVNDLEQITEGNLVYVTKNIFDGETIYQWKSQDDETYLYTRTNTPGVKPAVYDSPESTEALANDYIISESGEYLIYTIDGTEYINAGLYSEQKIYLKGFYVKTSTDLQKLASQVDLPTKVSELENDSNYVHTVNNKQSTDGTVTINGDDINVSFQVYDTETGETVPYENTLSGMGQQTLNNLSIMLLYLEDVYANKAITSDIPTKVSQLENDTNFITKEAIPESETYVLNFTISDGVNTGEYSSDEYTKLLAAVKSGKLVIVKGGATRVTADSQAIADKDAYVVIRYSTPRISDDNTSITISFYELKFGAIDSSGICKYQSKAIHKTI